MSNTDLQLVLIFQGRPPKKQMNFIEIYEVNFSGPPRQREGLYRLGAQRHISQWSVARKLVCCGYCLDNFYSAVDISR